MSNLENYRREMIELHLARAEAGGILSQEEESKFVGRFYTHWRSMSEEDHNIIEQELDDGLTVSEEPRFLDREVFVGSEITPRLPV